MLGQQMIARVGLVVGRGYLYIVTAGFFTALLGWLLLSLPLLGVAIGGLSAWHGPVRLQALVVTGALIGFSYPAWAGFLLRQAWRCYRHRAVWSAVALATVVLPTEGVWGWVWLWLATHGPYA